MPLSFNVDNLCKVIPKPSAIPAFRQLMTFIQNDQDIADIRWVAYILATIRWECAGTWAPIEEYGKGVGKTYGQDTPYVVGDAIYHNRYYGRGYVQTTWLGNYLRMSKEIGLGDLLARHPEKALDPEISYAMMSHGMRKGLYTGVGLPKFINDVSSDYVNARRIINGLDQAQTIANFAITFEHLLRDNLTQ